MLLCGNDVVLTNLEHRANLIESELAGHPLAYPLCAMEYPLDDIDTQVGCGHRPRNVAGGARNAGSPRA